MRGCNLDGLSHEGKSIHIRTTRNKLQIGDVLDCQAIQIKIASRQNDAMSTSSFSLQLRA
jgi:hypothetical protein